MMAATDDIDALWSDFLAAWPPERVRKMTLEEYTNSDKDDAFIYWIESRLDKLGSIWGGSAFKFGIYCRDNTEAKPPSRGRIWGDTYAWQSKFGKTEQEAFATIRARIIETLDAAQAGNFERVDEIDLAPVLKWKVAFLYQDQAHPGVFPIFKKDALFHHYKTIDPTAKRTATPHSVMYATLLERHGEDGDVLRVAEDLWAQWAYNEEMPVCLDPPNPATVETLFRICHELRVRGIEFSQILKVWLAVLERHRPGGEQAYLDLIQGIEPQHLEKMSEGFYLLLQHFTMEGSYYDLLGDVYQRMSVEWKGKAFGQYFTPWAVCLITAQTTIDEAAIEKVKRGETVTIHEPAVGSGALLLAAKGVIAQRAGRWRTRFVKVSGQDLDPVCVDMAKIQVAMTDDRFMVNWGLLNVAELKAQQIAQAANRLDAKRVKTSSKASSKANKKQRKSTKR